MQKSTAAISIKDKEAVQISNHNKRKSGFFVRTLVSNHDFFEALYMAVLSNRWSMAN